MFFGTTLLGFMWIPAFQTALFRGRISEDIGKSRRCSFERCPSAPERRARSSRVSVTRSPRLRMCYPSDKNIKKGNIGSRGEKEPEDTTHRLLLTRREVDSMVGRGSLRTHRKTTLGEVGIYDLGPGDTIIDAAILITRFENDFKVTGHCKTFVVRNCDRCLKSFQVEANGTFEVVLCTRKESLKKLEMEVEAVEEFIGGTASVGLESHVHDAVRLALPTKALCDVECQGVIISEEDAEFVEVSRMEADSPSREGASKIESKKLLELKKRLSGLL